MEKTMTLPLSKHPFPARPAGCRWSTPRRSSPLPAAAALCALFALAGPAAAGELAGITKTTTARATPSDSGASRGQALKGDTYAVSRKQGEWIEVQYSDRKAWLKKAHVSVKQGTLKRAHVALNVRAGAGTNHSVLGTLPKHSWVAERGGTGTWRKISFLGKTGWVFGAYLKSDGGGPSAGPGSSPGGSSEDDPGGSGGGSGSGSGSGSGDSGGSNAGSGASSGSGGTSSGGASGGSGSSNTANPGSSTPTPAQPAASGANKTAVFQSTSNAGQRNQMKTGTITINDRAYRFRNGGFGRGSIPTGTYTISPHLWSRSDPSMSVGGVGWSFAMSDKYDPRVGGTRSLLRIHPDGGSPGTEGCIGIVGDAATQRRFREDMRAEFARSGNSFTLTIR